MGACGAGDVRGLPACAEVRFETAQYLRSDRVAEVILQPTGAVGPGADAHFSTGYLCREDTLVSMRGSSPMGPSAQPFVLAPCVYHDAATAKAISEAAITNSSCKSATDRGVVDDAHVAEAEPT